ncbi:hypothetical protein CC86DRAFT_458619 [Ophiobolus disseminans]|uniref:F-box domain-containing protein n=1 Tax=Ophiobolus disseminans TaxID=1469910 RepID=A0A6A6ZMH0_9PLEO|nr:hypothetical protein CC86DRAFT_458619 [Ophiobolus disseminans]
MKHKLSNSKVFKRWGESNKRATAMEVYNVEFSPIYKLHPELLLTILGLLSMTDHLCLCLYSRWFASLIQRLHRQSKTKACRHDKLELQARLVDDRFFRLADTENVHAKKLLCSSCRKPHRRSKFQPQELTLHAHTRRCKGHTSPFKPCPHTEISYTQILDSLSHKGRFTPRLCSTWPNYFSCRLKPSIFRCATTGTVFYKSKPMHKRFPKEREVSRLDIQDYMAELAEQICRHMRTEDSAFMRRVMETSTLKMPYTMGMLFAPPGASNSMDIYCSARYCSTRVAISRWPDHGGGALVARVYLFLNQTTRSKSLVYLKHKISLFYSQAENTYYSTEAEPALSLKLICYVRHRSEKAKHMACRLWLILTVADNDCGYELAPAVYFTLST